MAVSLESKLSLFLFSNVNFSVVWFKALIEPFGRLFWVKRPFESIFQSISDRLPERKKEKRKDERKNVQTTPTRTYCNQNRPLSYYNQISRTPRHWKFTQHLCISRPLPFIEPIILHATVKLASHRESLFPSGLVFSCLGCVCNPFLSSL